MAGKWYTRQYTQSQYPKYDIMDKYGRKNNLRTNKQIDICTEVRQEKRNGKKNQS